MNWKDKKGNSRGTFQDTTYICLEKNLQSG